MYQTDAGLIVEYPDFAVNTGIPMVSSILGGRTLLEYMLGEIKRVQQAVIS